jgi:hypothetical protein
LLPFLLRSSAVLFRRQAKIQKNTPQLNWLLEAAWALLDELDSYILAESRRVSSHPAALLLARVLADQTPPADVPTLKDQLRNALEALEENRISPTSFRELATLLENVAAAIERTAA